MRKEADQFTDSTFLEGMTSIRALIHAKDAGVNDRPIEVIYYDSADKTRERDLTYLRAKSMEYRYRLEPKTRKEIDDMAIGNTHGGLIAKCGARSLPRLTDSVAALHQNGFYALIDGIEDPYNFGYAIRSLYACGADGIIIDERNWLSAAGVVARSSAGASESIPVFLASAETAVPLLRDNGFLTVAADLRTENKLGETPLPRPVLLVCGGEKRGISRRVLDTVDLRVKIPYGREFRASLSAASAVTMFAYEIMRQNLHK